MSVARRAALFLPLILTASFALVAFPAAAADTPGEAATEELFFLVLIPALGIGILVQGLILYAVFKFRRRRGHAEPPANPKVHDAKLEATWTIIPAIILLIVGLATFQTLVITDTIPENPDVVVTVTGRQFFWTFSADNGTSVVNTSGEFTVRVGQVVKLLITSGDVIHALYIQGFTLKVDAVPGHVNEYWFQALNTGDFEIRCAELCGSGHTFMVGMVHVVP